MVITRVRRAERIIELKEWGGWENARRYASIVSQQHNVNEVEIYEYVHDPEHYEQYEEGELRREY